MMPPFSISSPATMKSGIDMSGKELTEFIRRGERTERSKPDSQSPAIADTPSEKASGMPRKASTRKRTMTRRLMPEHPA